MSSLAQEKCVPCTKRAIRELGLERLSEADAAAKLKELQAGWALAPQPQPQTPDAPAAPFPPALQKVYRFRNFATAAAFARTIGEVADAEGHHPAILVEWGSVAVWWWSHSLGGVRWELTPAAS